MTMTTAETFKTNNFSDVALIQREEEKKEKEKRRTNRRRICETKGKHDYETNDKKKMCSVYIRVRGS